MVALCLHGHDKIRLKEAGSRLALIQHPACLQMCGISEAAFTFYHFKLNMCDSVGQQIRLEDAVLMKTKLFRGTNESHVDVWWSLFL